MSFEFKTPEICSQLHGGLPRRGLLPRYAQSALAELMREVEGRVASPLPSGRRVTHCVSRSYKDVCAIVDWAASISRWFFGGRYMSTDDFVLGELAEGDADFDREFFVGSSTIWLDFDEPGEPYLDPARYPPPYPMEIEAVGIGNFCAALGLAVLDRLVNRMDALDQDKALEELGFVWKCVAVARVENHILIETLFEQ